MNVRRVSVAATKDGRINPEYSEAVAKALEGLPTAERLRAAGQDYSTGGDDRSGKRYVMRDTPLDRALSRNIVSGAEHSALQKYYLHWYLGGQAPHVGSVDLNRIYTAEEGSLPGIPKTMSQVYHRDEWRQAREHIGLRSASILQLFVCDERSLEYCGQTLGWTSKPQAIAAASQVISDSGYRLARLWGIG